MIVAREGIDALTMRRLADSLGCSTMGLYRHARDKDELLMPMIDRRAALWSFGTYRPTRA